MSVVGIASVVDQIYYVLGLTTLCESLELIHRIGNGGQTIFEPNVHNDGCTCINISSTTIHTMSHNVEGKKLTW